MDPQPVDHPLFGLFRAWIRIAHIHSSLDVNNIIYLYDSVLLNVTTVQVAAYTPLVSMTHARQHNEKNSYAAN